MITIDGSKGEGGGQILRTSLALSIITGQPFSIRNIRGGRKKPGLLRQHLTAVRGAKEISGAEVQGDSLGSGELLFNPGALLPGNYNFHIDSAGSASLVLQTVLLPLAAGKTGSRVTLGGGTHNSMAPPYHFLEQAYFPILKQMGCPVNCSLHRFGFHPAGGGLFTIETHPFKGMNPISFSEPVETFQIKAYAFSARIPKTIIEKECRILRETFRLKPEECICQEVSSPGPGNVVMLEVKNEALTTLFTGFGARGLPLEKVCNSVIKEAREYMDAKAPVDRHLADQLLLPMALAEGRSEFLTLEPTLHTITNAEIIKTFLGRSITIAPFKENINKITVG